MKRQPVLVGLLILGVILIVFIGSIVLISYFFRREPPTLAFGDKVGVVEIMGVITDPKETIHWIKTFREDKGIKAIVLRIDSPGGAVGASQEIYREVMKTRKFKKVVASMGNVAASGGYYIASAAHKIVANPGTITGSIGVVMQFTNAEELLKKIGLRGYVIKSAPHKDIGSPFREMTKQEKALLQEVIDNVHRQFVKAVAEGRGLPLREVEKIADGRIFSGEQALKLGLVDRLGSFEDAVSWAAELAGIKGKPHLVYGRRRPRILDYLIEGVVKVWKREILERFPQLAYLWVP